MTFFTRTFKTAFLLVAGMSAMAQAQETKTSVFIQTTITFNATFLQYLDSNRISVTDDSGLPLQNGADSFSSNVPAPVDLVTGVDEIITGGGYRVVKGDTTYRILDLISTRTNASTVNISAFFIVNGKAIGRLPLFVVSGPPLPIPLKNPPDGILPNTSGLTLSFAPPAASLFGGRGTDTSVGTFTILGVLNPNGN